MLCCSQFSLLLCVLMSSAKEGHYGAYLCARRDWPLIYQIVRWYLPFTPHSSSPLVACAHLHHRSLRDSMRMELSVPVCCKIRLLSSLPLTIEFAQMLEAAGCSLLVSVAVTIFWLFSIWLPNHSISLIGCASITGHTRPCELQRPAAACRTSRFGLDCPSQARCAHACADERERADRCGCAPQSSAHRL
jgi:hypothetical protein